MCILLFLYGEYLKILLSIFFSVRQQTPKPENRSGGQETNVSPWLKSRGKYKPWGLLPRRAI